MDNLNLRSPLVASLSRVGVGRGMDKFDEKVMVREQLWNAQIYIVEDLVKNPRGNRESVK